MGETPAPNVPLGRISAVPPTAVADVAEPVQGVMQPPAFACATGAGSVGCGTVETDAGRRVEALLALPRSPLHEQLVAGAHMIRREAGVALLNFDVVVEQVTQQPYVVDINYFPSFSGVPFMCGCLAWHARAADPNLTSACLLTGSSTWCGLCTLLRRCVWRTRLSQAPGSEPVVSR